MNTQPILNTEWAELRVLTPPFFEEMIVNILDDLVSNGIEIRDQDTVLKSGGSDDLLIIAYYPAAEVTSKQRMLLTRLAEQQEMTEVDWSERVQVELIENTDWATAWQKHFHPIELTQRFVVCPSWERYEARPEQIVIEIDPAMAFGTGEHETTRLCVQALEFYMQPGFRVLDLGTGTAILAMVTEKLDAKRILAVDNDIDAIQAAEENLPRNQCHKIELRHSEIELCPPEEAFDLVVANLQTHIIRENWSAIQTWFGMDTIGILSGILVDHHTGLTTFLAKAGFDVLEAKSMNEWLQLTVKKRA